MVIGVHLLYAILAGFFGWLVGLVVAQLGGPAWLVSVLSGAGLVYAFWVLITYGPITVGR